VFLVGCITTTTGDVPVPADRKDTARINMDLGIKYLEKGNLEQAVLKLRRSIEDDPDNATAHRALGMAYQQFGDMEGAEKEYRAAVRLDSEDPDALNQLATFLCLRGEPREAIRYFDRALEIPLNRGRYLIATNAGTCAKDVDLELAENYLRRALITNPTFADALYQLADVAYRRENYLQARAFVERRLDAAPASPGVLWVAYRTEVALQDQAAADLMGRRLAKEFPTSVEARLMAEMQREGNGS
jgi:type IV pilus assembly protein PilF